MTTNGYTPKRSAIEAYAMAQEMAEAAGMTINELAKINGLTCGYELVQKIAKEIENS